MFNNVEKGATYAFRVAAVTEAGQGEFSQWAKVDTPSPPKTGIIVYLLPNFR